MTRLVVIFSKIILENILKRFLNSKSQHLKGGENEELSALDMVSMLDSLNDQYLT